MLWKRIAEYKEPILMASMALFLTLLLAYATEIPVPDIGRYGNIVRSFVEKDWEHVFHPRISPLMPLAAGSIAWITGWEAFAVLKLVSSLFFALTVFPVYGIFRRIFSQNATRIALLMTVFASVPMRYGASGLRDSAKGFFFILCVYFLVRIFTERERLHLYLSLGAASALLALTRTECAVYSGLFLFSAFCFEAFYIRKPWRSFCGIAVALFLMLPWLVYMTHITGYPVPEIRYVPILKKIISEAGQKPHLFPFPASAQPVPSKNTQEVLAQTSSWNVHAQYEGFYRNFILDLIGGFYPEFGLLALAGIFLRIRRKEWTPLETIVLSALLLHALLLILQIYISDHRWYLSRRYLLPITALEFGWSGWFVCFLWSKVTGRWSGFQKPVYAVILILIFAIGLYVHAFQRIIKTHTSRGKSLERIALSSISGYIRTDYKGPRTFLHKNVPQFDFQTNRLPIVVSEWEQLGFLSGGQSLFGADPLFASHQITPDYIVVAPGGQSGEELRKNGYRLNKVFQIKKQKFELYSKSAAVPGN